MTPALSASQGQTDLVREAHQERHNRKVMETGRVDNAAFSTQVLLQNSYQRRPMIDPANEVSHARLSALGYSYEAIAYEV